MRYAGIVLAGGSARRLSGVDKPGLLIGGVPLLGRAVDALSGARPVVVVGPERAGFGPVVWTREAEAGAGPVPALAAGLAMLESGRTGLVVVLAGDLIGVRRSTVDRLVASLGGRCEAAGAVLVDSTGKRQWLLGAWRTESLRMALPEQAGGASLQSMLGELSIVDLPEIPGESSDIDTPENLDRLRRDGC